MRVFNFLNKQIEVNKHLEYFTSIRKQFLEISFQMYSEFQNIYAEADSFVSLMKEAYQQYNTCINKTGDLAILMN